MRPVATATDADAPIPWRYPPFAPGNYTNIGCSEIIAAYDAQIACGLAEDLAAIQLETTQKLIH